MPVLFYRPDETYGGFCNFSGHPVFVYDNEWPTSEHAFQAMKFSPHRLDLLHKVRLAKTPREAANIGRDRSNPIHESWETPPLPLFERLPDARHPLLHPDDGMQHRQPLFNALRDLVMYEVVYAKMTQHPDLRALLLGTRDDAIIEASSKDAYWGWGADRRGENKLGRILMAVRNALSYGALSETALGKPSGVKFRCTALYPWRAEYGPGEHPDATSMGREGYECLNCGLQFE